MTDDAAVQEPVRHEFAFAASYRLPALLFGITPRTTWLDIGPAGLRVRYGPWRMATSLDNIAEATITGGFTFLKTAGPPHLSFGDRGVSFTTNARAALCLAFHAPVKAIDPTGFITHPGATLSVADPQALLADVRRLVPGVGVPAGQ
ncbi:hypothetical protein [Nocardioides sp.]|uniref:hypothetical protein n=1 Tax=Nocardioides sp. TaxID=35761 RepID=UPI00321B41ED